MITRNRSVFTHVLLGVNFRTLKGSHKAMPSQFRATSKAMLSRSAEWFDVFESRDVTFPTWYFQIAVHTSNVEKYSHVVGDSVLLNLKNYLKIN